MEQSRKYLKTFSLLVLVFILATVLTLISWLMDINNATIPDGASDNIFEITKRILVVISGILFYLKFKGIKIANNPNSSRFRIEMTTIVSIFILMSLISSAIALI